jgi:hypothetical protein
MTTPLEILFKVAVKNKIVRMEIKLDPVFLQNGKKTS